VGLLLAAIGAFAWRARPASRTGPLVLLTGATWLLGDLIGIAIFLHRGPLVHAALGYPDGRQRSAASRVVVVMSYLVAAIYALSLDDAVSCALAGCVVAAAAWDFGRATGPARRTAATGLAAAALVAAALAVGPLTRLLDVQSNVPTLAVYDALVMTAALVLVVDLVQGRWAEATLTELVIDLGDRSGTTGLRDRLAAAIGDRTLVVGYWLRDQQRYVDEEGHALSPDELAPASAGTEGQGAGRTATPVLADGEPLAVLVHDRAAVDEQLLSDVTAAVRFAVSNARLRAEVAAHVADVESSRRRLVTTADDELRRLEVRLRRGAARRLETVSALLEGAPPELRSLSGDVGRARGALDDLAVGLYPPELAAGDLHGALRELVSRSAVTVAVDVTGAEVGPAAAGAAYFICSEALTNVAKYSGTGHATVRVVVTDDLLHLDVTDQGIGGADPARGTGLRGLADRAEALGGSLTVTSAIAGGTRVTLRLPLQRRSGRQHAAAVGSPVTGDETRPIEHLESTS
jgi:signal transduction histidine kinase